MVRHENMRNNDFILNPYRVNSFSPILFALINQNVQNKCCSIAQTTQQMFAITFIIEYFFNSSIFIEFDMKFMRKSAPYSTNDTKNLSSNKLLGAFESSI